MSNEKERKAYQAHGPAGTVVSYTSPRDAAIKYFLDFPKSRKCRVTEGTYDGFFFTLRFGPGEPTPRVWDVTSKKDIPDLPQGEDE